MTPLGLSTYRWNNNIKSMLLLAAFPCLLLGLVAAFFFIVGWQTAGQHPYVSPHLPQQFGLPALTGPATPIDFAIHATTNCAPFIFALAGIWILIGTFFNESLIRMAAHAQPVYRSQVPELYNLLENLCILRGLTMPSLYIIDTPAMNAYASGLSKGSFSITVTRGLLEALDKDELEAVLAHELTHIMNRDVRLLVVTVLFGGMLSFFAEMAWRSMRYGMFLGNTDNDNDNRQGMATWAIMLVAAIILSVGYVISILFRFALSRRREYLADAGAVELTKRPESLIRALEKISGNAAMPAVPSGVQAMMIENPPGFFDLFDTHPPVEARIAVLRRLGNIPEEGHSIIPRTGR